MNQLPIWAQWAQLAIAGGIATFAAFIAYRQWRSSAPGGGADFVPSRLGTFRQPRPAKNILTVARSYGGVLPSVAAAAFWLAGADELTNSTKSSKHARDVV